MSFDATQRAYISLRDQIAERTKPIIVWIGAGLSAQAGLPTWSRLKELLISAGNDKARTFDRSAREKMERQISVAIKEPNPWIAFKMLKETIGETTYYDEVRKALGPASREPIPKAYLDIWSLPIRGVLNLNIDRMATRAFMEVRLSALPVEFNGLQTGNMTHVLNGARPFIANLHGNVDAVNTWVFTNDELAKLLRNLAYQNFIRSCISTHSVILVGMTADDRAVGGHLEWFAKHGIKTGPHYWLTDKADGDSDEWAERAGIRLIRYSSQREDHREVHECFTNILAHVPQEETSSLVPVVLSTAPVTDREALLPPGPLVREETDKIRRLLNQRARELLSERGMDRYANYEQFCAEYDEAIHRAWYVSTRPGSNALLEYRLIEEVARGAFAHVYRATDKDGQEVAIKLLLEEIRNNGDLLRSFRRGVKSMKILHDNRLAGMVDYVDATEIPAFVAMEWIDGPNLHQAVKSRQLNDWALILKVARDLARIVGAAHSLPERVLHRDLRPSNIMLKDFYTRDDWAVVVLDFDLSWHRGAIERSVLHSTVMGYLAPEQIHSRSGMSTRSAAVDSYGFGMTLYFMCTGQDPITEQHKHQDWSRTLDQIVAAKKCSSWKCLPNRVARLIFFTTQDEQFKRPDMAQINAELSLLYDCLTVSTKTESTEIIAEEIAARTEYMRGYKWDLDRSVAMRESQTGVKVTLTAIESTSSVELKVGWEAKGVEDRRRLADLVGAAMDRVSQKLKSGGWSSVRQEGRTGGWTVYGEIDRDYGSSNVAKVAAAIDSACEQIRMN